jgi:hypothetical protein
VRARSAHFGRVNVPVLIKERQTTFVYLDGLSHPEAASARQSNAVKLPDGEIVGWSSTIASASPNWAGCLWIDLLSKAHIIGNDRPPFVILTRCSLLA